MSSTSTRQPLGDPLADAFYEGREEFDALLGQVSAAPPTGLLGWLNRYFDHKAKARAFKRKPSMRFRSTFEERQIDVQPRWRNIGTFRAKEVVRIPGQLEFGLNVFHDRHKAYRRQLQLLWQPAGQFSLRSLSGGYRKGFDELQLLCRFFKAAAADIEGTLRAGAAGHCCFCGKPLTDPVSMSRGIGPECFRDFIGFSEVEPYLACWQEGGE